MKSKQLYRFGPYTLDGEERVLCRSGVPVTLPPKDLEVLFVLVENAGHIVGKEELLEKVWQGVFVEEGNLSRHIFNLRQVLGESEGQRQYIETVPKRGYRFIATAPAEAVELAGSGVSVAQTAEPARTPTSLERKQSLWLWPVVVSAALALTAGLVSRYWPGRSAPPPKVMLAVLPFENLSGDAREDYFADGLTEEMIAQLGQLQPSQLGVIARTSVVRYKNTKETANQIGRELGVGYLLEGSARRAGERVRITAQLIRTTEQTDLWAETYERPLTDVLNIQREIAERITHSLSIQLLPGMISPPAASADVESYDKYLLGLHDLGEGTRDSINKAIEHFQEATARNPRDARFYSALGEAYEALNTYYSSPSEMMPRVRAAATQALQIDPGLAGGHVLLGDVRLLFEWDWPAAEAEYRRALEINPSLPEAQLGYATYLATLGRFDEALSRVEQAYTVDPLAIDSRNNALWIYYFSGRMSETVQQSQKAIELEPAAGLPYAMLAMAYAKLGQRADALHAAESAVRLANSPSVITTTASALAHVGQSDEARQLLANALEQAKARYVCRFIVGAAYAELGDKQQALDSLEEGYLQRST